MGFFNFDPIGKLGELVGIDADKPVVSIPGVTSEYTPAQKQPGAVSEAYNPTDTNMAANSLLRAAAAREVEAVSASGKAPSQESMLKLLSLANASSMTGEDIQSLQQQATLEQMMADFDKVAREGSEEEQAAFIDSLGSSENAKLLRSLQGLDETASTTAEDDALAQQEEIFRMQESEYERSALLDFIGVFPDKMKGGMLLDLMQDEHIQSLFFPGLAKSGGTTGGFVGPGGATLGRPSDLFGGEE
jgi:hypothetical protein